MQVDDVLARMRASGVTPDVVSYGSLIKAAVSAGSLARAEQLLSQMEAAGVRADVVLLNTLLGGYAEQLQWERAFSRLAQMRESGAEPDILSYSLLLRACVRAKVPAAAARAVRMMREEGLKPNGRMHAMLLSAYAQAGWLKASLEQLRTMQSEGVRPNAYAFSALMEACIVSGKPETAEPLFVQMLGQGVAADSVTHTLRIRALLAQARPGDAVRGDNARSRGYPKAAQAVGRRSKAVTKDMLAKMMENMDVDGDGKVDKKEFLAPYLRIFPSTTEKQYEAVWAAVDSDRSGDVTIDELADFYGFRIGDDGELEETPEMTDEQILQALAMAAELSVAPDGELEGRGGGLDEEREGEDMADAVDDDVAAPDATAPDATALDATALGGALGGVVDSAHVPEPAPTPGVAGDNVRDTFVARAFDALAEMRRDRCEVNVITYNVLILGCVRAGDAASVEASLRQMLLEGVSPNRKTFEALAAEMPVRRGATAAETALARVALLDRAVDAVADFGRQLDGTVYIALLRAYAAAASAEGAGSHAGWSALVHARISQRMAERPTFVLRRSHLAEAETLEESVLGAVGLP